MKMADFNSEFEKKNNVINNSSEQTNASRK